jgi:hypothetical protein
MDIVLKFFIDQPSIQFGYFFIKNLITADSKITYDNIALEINGIVHDRFFTMDGKELTVPETFELVLNHYFMSNIFWFDFSRDWSVIFDKYRHNCFKGSLITRLPVIHSSEIEYYDLIFATEEHKLYTHNNKHLVIFDNSDVCTDINCILTCLYNDMNANNRGELEYLYIDDSRIKFIIDT